MWVELKKNLVIAVAASLGAMGAEAATLQSVHTPFNQTKAPGTIVLQNDSYADTGMPATLQLGFVTGEKAGVWVKVPAGVKNFKADYFRVLMTDADGTGSMPVQVYFQAGTAAAPSAMIPATVSNAAQVTAGPYWNDIPLLGDGNQMACAQEGEYVGAALEFTHSGAPSIFSDTDGMANAMQNVLFAIPGGWNPSVAFGVRGDWVLRIVGHSADASECP